MSDKKPTPPKTPSEQAVQWCVGARKLLKLNVVKRNSLDLKKRATALKGNLEKLRTQFGQKAAAQWESDFKAIAQRIDEMAHAGDLASVEVQAEELNVLNKTLLLKLAEKDKNPTKAKKEAEGELAQARLALAKKKEELEPRYRKLLSTAEERLKTLRTIRYGAPAALQARIETAKKKVAGSEPDWAAGADMLVSTESLFESGRHEAETWQERELLHARQQPHYESKQQKLGEVLSELLAIVGTDEERKLVARAQRAGADAIKRQDGHPLQIALYDDGYKAIAALVPSTKDLLSSAVKSAGKAQRLVMKDTEIQGAEKAARDALQALRLPGAELLDETAAADHEFEIGKAVLLAGRPEKKPFGIKRLQEITGELGTLKGRLQTARDTCRDGLKEAEAARDALLYAPTPDERQALIEPLALLEAAGALAAAIEFDEANGILTPLLQTLNGLRAASDHTPDKLELQWNKLAATRLPAARRQIEQLRTLLEQNKLPDAPNLISDGQAAIFARGLDVAERRAGDKNWAQAIEEANQISKDLRTGMERHRLLNAFVTQRNTLAQPVADEIRRAEEAIEKLQTALASEDDPGNTLLLAQGELAKAKDAWYATMARAGTEAELGAAAAQQKFKALADRLQKQTASPQALARAVSAGRDDAASKAFDVLSAEATTALDGLRVLDAGAAEQHLKTWTDIRHSAFRVDLTSPGGPHEQMGALKGTIEQATATARLALGNARTAAQTRYDEVALQLKALRETATKSLRHRHRKVFAAFFDELDQSLRDLAGMIGSSSAKTVQAAPGELAKIAARALRLKNEVEAQPREGSREAAQALLDEEEDLSGGIVALFDEAPPDAKAPPSFRLVMEAVAVITRMLRDKQLQRCMPVQKAQLDADFANLQKSVQDIEPEAAFVELRAFSSRVRDALARAATAAELRARFSDVELPLAQQRFKTLSGYEAGTLRAKIAKRRKDPGAYMRELESRIAAAKAQIKEPQREQRALDALARIVEEIDAVINENGVVQGMLTGAMSGLGVGKALKDQPEGINSELLVAHEKAAREREFQQRKESEQWDALVTDFERMQLARAEKAVNDAEGGDDSQITDLHKMLKQARGVFKDSGSFIGAVELLNAAKQYAERVIRQPAGLLASARDQLPQTRARWKQAVAAFNGSVDKVVDSIHSADEGLDTSGLFGEDDGDGGAARKRQQAAVAKSVELLGGLKRLFNADIMDGPITTLVSKNADVADKRAQREVAMRYINNYRDLLRSDPVLLKMLQKNPPFGTVNFYGLNAALRDLDLNIQRAV